MSQQLEFSFFDPDAPPGAVLPPGEFLRRELEAKQISQTDLAKITGRPLGTINEIIKGKRAIMPEMAMALGAALGTPPALWMHREAAFRISQITAEDEDSAKKSSFYQIAPVTEMETRGWISATRNASELECELKRFYRVENLAEIEIQAAARQTSRTDEFSPSQKAWLHQAKRMAEVINVRSFSQVNIRDNLTELRKLAISPEKTRHVPRLLSELGIRFIVVEQMNRGGRIDGAVFWLDDSSPVVALSLRYDRMDCFWFTLAHELAHIWNGDKRSLDSDIAGPHRLQPINEMEEKADTEGADWLIKIRDIQSLILRVGPYYSRDAINLFSKRIGVHPGIVVGQLQHRKEIGYQVLRDTLVKVRDTITTSALTDGWGKKTSNLIR